MSLWVISCIEICGKITPASGSFMKSHKGEVPYCCKADGAAGIKQGTSVCMRKLYHRHRWTRIAYGKCARKTHNYWEIQRILFIAVIQRNTGCAWRHKSHCRWQVELITCSDLRSICCPTSVMMVNSPEAYSASNQVAQFSSRQFYNKGGRLSVRFHSFCSDT